MKKQPLRPDRIRRPPKEGWSWLDRRFLLNHSDPLSREALLLYFFLAAVSDKDGLSYYSDLVLESRLRLEKAILAQARDDLVARDLIAFNPPLYQVLSLPVRKRAAAGGSGPTTIGSALRELASRYAQIKGGEL